MDRGDAESMVSEAAAQPVHGGLDDVGVGGLVAPHTTEEVGLRVDHVRLRRQDGEHLGFGVGEHHGGSADGDDVAVMATRVLFMSTVSVRVDESFRHRAHERPSRHVLGTTTVRRRQPFVRSNLRAHGADTADHALLTEDGTKLAVHSLLTGDVSQLRIAGAAVNVTACTLPAMTFSASRRRGRRIFRKGPFVTGSSITSMPASVNRSVSPLEPRPSSWSAMQSPTCRCASARSTASRSRFGRALASTRKPWSWTALDAFGPRRRMRVSRNAVASLTEAPRVGRC